jgi:hypothetical protein
MPKVMRYDAASGSSHSSLTNEMGNIMQFPKETSLSRVEVQRRLDGWRVGPTTCKAFESLNPEPCQTCPYKGKITSPIVLGRRSSYAPVVLQHNVPIPIQNANLWALRPDLAPAITGPAFIEIKNCWYPPGDKGDEFMRPFLMHYAHGRIQHFCKLDFEPNEAFEGRFVHPWASWILSAAMSINAYYEATADGWLIVGATRLTEPYRRIVSGIYDKSGRAQTEPTGYECHATDEDARRITMSGRGSGNPSSCIDPLLCELENYLPAYLPAPASPIAAAMLNDIEDEFSETSENITRFCTALTFVDPSDYPEWFRGLCAIASAPWRQATKDNIAVWWSKRTARHNYPGDDEVRRKLNMDISADRRGGITYRSIFKLAHERGWDG